MQMNKMYGCVTVVRVPRTETGTRRGLWSPIARTHRVGLSEEDSQLILESEELGGVIHGSGRVSDKIEPARSKAQ